MSPEAPTSPTTQPAEVSASARRTIELTLGHNIDAHPGNAAKQLEYLERMHRDGVLDRYDEYKRVTLRRLLAEKERCSECGRALKTDESRQRGIGPECWSKVERPDG